MRVCVVGNGPSAKGHGAEIDACDFVVRIKAWWVYGAEDAGQRCDALAHYGGGARVDHPPCSGEYWFTRTTERSEWDRVACVINNADLALYRWVTKKVWQKARDCVGSDPSTGFVALSMAMAIFDPSELVLAGFDARGKDLPGFNDARGKPWPTDGAGHHDWMKEKQLIAAIRDGTWLGEPTDTHLTWYGGPICC